MIQKYFVLLLFPCEGRLEVSRVDIVVEQEGERYSSGQKNVDAGGAGILTFLQVTSHGQRGENRPSIRSQALRIKIIPEN